MIISHCHRPGPSASEAGESRLLALVDALKTVKGLLKDDGVKTSVRSIAPQLLNLFDDDSDDEATRAKNGLPSGSAPAGTGKKRNDEKNEVLPSPPKPTFVPAPADAAEPKQDEVNSSTHRAAHARLVRRMEKLDPVAFPQMCKLWSGSRKDTNVKSHRFVFFGEMI